MGRREQVPVAGDGAVAEEQIRRLIERLVEHALAEEPVMNPSQVAAAKMLIGELLPAVRPGDPDRDSERVEHIVRIELVAPHQ